jgi:hypothetical protein
VIRDIGARLPAASKGSYRTQMAALFREACRKDLRTLVRDPGFLSRIACKLAAGVATLEKGPGV